MKLFYILLFSLGLLSCGGNSNRQRGMGFKPISLSADTVKNITSTADTITIDKVEDLIQLADFIDTLIYVPLETTKESLFAYNTQMKVYKNHIYIMDDLVAEAVLVFGTDGHFIKRIGDKGGAPYEFSLLQGMTIDEKRDRLALYDNKKGKIMYFTLDGDYIENTEVNFRYNGEMEFLPSGNLVSATCSWQRNVHLNNLDNYRLLYTDSTGNIVKAGFNRNDNKNLSTQFETLTNTPDGILYHPHFINALYNVTDSAIIEKYVIDYKHASPLSQEKFLSLSNMEELKEFSKGTMYLSGGTLAENTSHLVFKTEGKDQFYTFYDKNAKNYIAFKGCIYSQGMIFNMSPIYSYKDFFVTTVSGQQLIAMRDAMKKDNIEIPSQWKELYEKIQADDNPVAVFFKVKPL